MTSIPVRIAKDTLATVQQLSRALKKPKREILHEAVKQYDRKQRLGALAESVRRLQANPRKWAAYQREVAAFHGEAAYPENKK